MFKVESFHCERFNIKKNIECTLTPSKHRPRWFSARTATRDVKMHQTRWCWSATPGIKSQNTKLNTLFLPQPWICTSILRDRFVDVESMKSCHKQTVPTHWEQCPCVMVSLSSKLLHISGRYRQVSLVVASGRCGCLKWSDLLIKW